MKPARINDRSNIMTLVWGVIYGSRGEACITTWLDDDSGRRTKKTGDTLVNYGVPKEYRIRRYMYRLSQLARALERLEC